MYRLKSLAVQRCSVAAREAQPELSADGPRSPGSARG